MRGVSRESHFSPISDRCGMQLRFEIAIDDIMAFYRYHFAHSPTIRNQKLLLIAFVAAIAITASLIIDSEVERTTQVIYAIVFTVVFGAYFHFRHGTSLEKQAKKLIAEGKNDGMLGTHQLTIEENALCEKTDVNETRHAWSAIDRVEETEDHAFIYISSIQAHVIPKHQISQGDYDSFIANVRQRVPVTSKSPT
jgi:hypothetical protein